MEILKCEEAIPIVLTGNVSANTMAVHQNMLGVYMNGGASGDTVPFCIRGIIKDVKKKGATGLTWTAGQKLYWDNSSNKQFATNATSNKDYQVEAVAAALATAVLGTVRLGGANAA